MAINLLKTVQERLGLAEVKKIDPNTQEVRSSKSLYEHRLAQATLTSVVAGIYNLHRSEKGMHYILETDPEANWLTILFGEKSNNLIQRICAYSMAEAGVVKDDMNKIAKETILVIREHSAGGNQRDWARDLVGAQRNNILPYLPAELQLGSLLEDDTLDDRTNKMEGPVSSLMHFIESGFSGDETAEEAKKKMDENK